MKRIVSLVLVALTLIIGAVFAAGCSPSTPKTISPADAAILAYADPATQTTLEGLSENNLAKYTQSANAEFKAAVTQDVFSQTAEQITSKLGSFESITFLRTEKQDVYTVVHYKAKFSKDEVGVRMVFDQDHLVAGQWFE